MIGVNYYCRWASISFAGSAPPVDCVVGLSNANLSDAFLWGADLSWAHLGKARLDSAVLYDANLASAQFSNVGENPATGLTQRQLDEARADPLTRPSWVASSMQRPRSRCTGMANRSWTRCREDHA